MKMKAVVYDKKHSPTRLVFCDVEKPVPQDDGVLVKIVASSVNAADYRSMKLGIIPKSGIFGADIAGRVEAVGKDVKKLKVGDGVFGDLAGCGFGGFAEYVAPPEHTLALKPSSVSFEEAAAVALAGVTALQGLRDQGNIQPGQKVLIVGAGGGVGTYAVQLAKYFGAEVTAVCGAQNVERVRSLGAGRVIDYTRENFSKNGEKYNLILAVNGSYPLPAYKRALVPGGIFVMVGGALSQVFSSMLFGPLLSIGSKKMRFLAAKPSVKDAEFLIKLVEEGKIKPIIDRRYPLSEAPEAMRYLTQGHACGKVIINVAQ